MKKKILITRKPPKHVLEMLKDEFEVDIWDSEEQQIPRKILLDKIEDSDGLLCLLTENIDHEVLEKGKNLKIISNLAVGYNNIDIKAASLRGIIVTNTPGVLTETTADLTFALMMATSRRLIEASNVLREGKWHTWSPMFLTGMDIHSKTLGIIGLGEIGAAVARRAKGFGMNLLYYNRTPKPSLEKELDIKFVSKETLLENSDFVCILTPLTKETINLITLKELKLMKKTAVLINTSRGGIVNEQDLFEALSNGEIWAAGLDVFGQEPVPVDHPLLNLSNVVALPHIGSASIQTRTKMWELAAQNLHLGLTGKVPPNIVPDQLNK
ncbi:2-hydroxyacid dehydrogenase [Bacillus sp. REN16]|uniref:2-hydroxyacid dehydrogenase n=1 Tax=Bacillus sp. REN16 TaxID=2887296 RepID=UPI001E3DFB13|nr:D-glycerate dehydrogenase [Bacillus sp. REN16]MCC3357296.1 D-glycerate dehydrogenase [Bacillus sp. REN16]